MSNLIKSWNNKTIRIRSDRYVSLTDMAQASGKQFGHWNNLKSTNSYLTTLSRSAHLSTNQLIEVNESSGLNESRGTWGHPTVAIRFAQWCSEKFAVQVDSWITTIMQESIFDGVEFESFLKTKSGFVYLAQSAETKYYKIGISTNPYKRMTQLQTGSPFEIVLVCRIFSLDAVSLEKALHKYYQKHWLRGEWFQLTPACVSEFESVANRLDSKLEQQPANLLE